MMSHKKASTDKRLFGDKPSILDCRNRIKFINRRFKPKARSFCTAGYPSGEVYQKREGFDRKPLNAKASITIAHCNSINPPIKFALVRKKMIVYCRSTKLPCGLEFQASTPKFPVFKGTGNPFFLTSAYNFFGFRRLRKFLSRISY